jgi:type I restriction enzyme, S subunit
MDSGEAWLGRIPRHWDLVRMKRVFRERNERGYPDEPLLAATQTKGVVRKDKYNSRTVIALKDLHLLKLVRKSDFVISLRSFQGGIEFARDQGIISPAYTVLYPRELGSHSYFAALFKSQPYIANLSSFVTGIRQGQNIDYQKLSRSHLPIPASSEQERIAGYISDIDQRCNRFIRKKRRVIELLNEQKQAIIHGAVTRGLDPTVPLKPSGIPWLGRIPRHWDVVQIRRLVSFVTSGSRGWANYYSDSGHIFLQSGNLGRSMSLNLSVIQHVNPPQGSEAVRTRVQRDDVLICVTGALTGNVAIVDVDLAAPAYVNQHVAIVRPKHPIAYPRYLAFVLHSEIGKAQFKTNEYGGTKQGLGLGDVKAVLVPLPKVPEQVAICAELQRSLLSFNTAIDRTEREIALIREYRTRLIADVVTGKIDVQDVRLEPVEPSPADLEPLDNGEAIDDELREEEDLEAVEEVADAD